MRVLLVDDDVPLRAMLRHTLETAGADVSGEAGDADTALREAHSHKPDVVLLDINLPGGGLNVLARLTDELPALAVVMLTARDDDHALLASLRGGASGYVLKGSDPWELPAALEDAVAGRPVLSAKAIGRLGHSVRESQGGFEEPLGDREREVLSRLRDGRSTGEIADELKVEPATVRDDVSSILRKLNLATREDALVLLEEAAEDAPA
jgi:DNA-binding NarL/FixJ family response regulator